MRCSRRVFLGILATSAVSCAREGEVRKVAKIPLGLASELIDGPNPYPLERVLIFKSGSSLRAMSLVCTHQHCIIRENGNGFICPCHGSNFDSLGTVQNGPATRNLPHYRLTVENEKLYIHIGDEVDSTWRFSLKPTQTT